MLCNQDYLNSIVILGYYYMFKACLFSIPCLYIHPSVHQHTHLPIDSYLYLIICCFILPVVSDKIPRG